MYSLLKVIFLLKQLSSGFSYQKSVHPFCMKIYLISDWILLIRGFREKGLHWASPWSLYYTRVFWI